MLNLTGYSNLNKINQNPRIDVFRVYDEKNQRNAVIKYISDEPSLIKHILSLQNEFDLLNNLQSEYTIAVYSFERLDTGYALIMEDGGISLKEYFKNNTNLGLIDYLNIAERLSEILSYLHRNQIIHKDIKPSNFVIHPKTKQIKILDFGISTRLNREEVGFRSVNIIEGSLPYISPEQTGRVNKMVDYRTDFYSLGITIYEILTGSVPFKTEDPIELVFSHITKHPKNICAINSEIPDALSSVVNTLLAKDPENRYQNALGIKYDLNYCKTILQNQTPIQNFQPKSKDISDKFQIPQKLYGRDNEIYELVSIFENMVASKNFDLSTHSQLLLVSGYSGIGKSSFINETHKSITQKNGYFLHGKFDQFQKNIPFSAIVQAFKGLMNFILTEPESKLIEWKRKLTEVLGINAQVIIDVVPELETIIGQQKSVPELGPVENMNRFYLTFQNFISTFTSKEHPIVLFIDDLQWADAQSLNLIKLLMTDAESKYLLIIGAYRDNEITSTHPLVALIDEIQKTNKKIKKIHLSPLSEVDIAHLISDTLHTKKDITKITKLICTKTGGNPFFLSELLKKFYKEELIQFDYEKNEWKWDEKKIFNYGITDNVVDLMVSNLKKLSTETINAISLAACMGNKFMLSMLSLVSKNTQAEAAKLLMPTILEGMLIPEGSDIELRNLLSKNSKKSIQKELLIRFQHDRVQQAAYSLISDDKKMETHLNIGKLLLKNTDGFQKQLLLEENIFEIIDHLIIGQSLITENQEKLELVKLSLLAGKKARQSAAYEAALKYLELSIKFLDPNSWESDYNLTVEIYKAYAEAEFLNSHFERAEEIIYLLEKKVKTKIEKAEALILLVIQQTLQARYADSIETARRAFSQLDFDLPTSKTVEAAFGKALKDVKTHLGNKEIASLVDSKENQDHRIRLLIQLLIRLDPPSYITGDLNLYMYVSVQAAALSLQYGNISESAKSFANYGLIVGSGLGDFQSGYQFGMLAVAVSKKFKSLAFECQADLLLGSWIHSWNKDIRAAKKYNLEGYHVGMDSGEVQFGSYNIFGYITNLWLEGSSLSDVQKTIIEFLPAINRLKNDLTTDTVLGIQLTIQILTDQPVEVIRYKTILDEERYRKQSIESALGYVTFCIVRSQSYYILGQYQDALKLLETGLPIIGSIFGFTASIDFGFYYSLILLRLYKDVDLETQKKYSTIISANQDQLKKWSDSFSGNFLHKWLVVEAELARLNGQDIDSIKLYNKAIDEVENSEFIQNKALIHDITGQFWLSKGEKRYTKFHIQKAYSYYQKWGATAKLKQLEDMYSDMINDLTSELSTRNFNSDNIEKTIMLTKASMNYSHALDLSSIIQASQVISSEIEFGKLLSKLSQILIENAGAQRVVIISNEAEKFLVVSDATENNKSIFIESPILVQDAHLLLPISVIQFVIRTHREIVIDDAIKDIQYSKEVYFQNQQTRSVLCTPVMNKGMLIAIVYLENNLTTGAFTNERVEILNTLAVQAAISIENARLLTQVVEVTKEKAKVATSMEIAKDIQTYLIPQSPIIHNYDIATYMQACDEVGGDYYDIINESERDWLVIGDVSGHGVTSGLIMMMVQVSLHTAIQDFENSNTNFESVLQKVNKIISKNIQMMNVSKYMTITVFLKKENTFYYAGLHQPILIYRKATNEVEKFENDGSWIGYYEDINEFPVAKFDMNLGDILVLYTDGVTESIDEKNKMFDDQCLIKLIKENKEKSMKEIKFKLLEELKTYKNEDDITFVLIKRYE